MTNLTNLYREFPPRFWIVVGVHFIDKIGATILFPFFALYITGRFDVGMTEAGILLGLLSLAGILGSVVGGALTDRLGRRKLILLFLVSAVLMGIWTMRVIKMQPQFLMMALGTVFYLIGFAYMAAFSLTVSLPSAIGPLAAGIVLDNYPPNLLWYLAALLCAISVIGFYALPLKLGAQPRFLVAPARSERGSLAMEAEHG